MKIDTINSYRNYNKPSKQTHFKAINQKYYNEAKRMYDKLGEISINWCQLMSYEVSLFKGMSKQDGIDTVKAVQKLIGGSTLGLDKLLKFYNNLND